jgi:hypothetical protein
LGASPRGIAVDSSGTVVVPIYQSGLGINTIALYTGAWEDRNFNSIRYMNRPLGFSNGGRQAGQTLSSSTITLTPTSLTAMVDTLSGPVTVNLIDATTYGTIDWVCTVADANNNAATNNITVYGNGFQIEDPNSPGTYSSSVTIHTNSQVVTWEFVESYDQWKVISSNASGGGGTVIGVPVGFINVGNANPSTGTLDSSHLQAIVDTSVATTTVNAPDLTLPTTQQLFRVTDDTGFAATYPITVQSQASRPIEDPNNQGNFATSVQISVNSQSIDWQWTGSHYKIV